MKSTDEQKESSDLYNNICTYENLRCAYEKARKHKTHKPYVKAFQEHLEENLQALHKELSTQTYKPAPLKTFILRDPKTRKISKSAFRDRIIHHALCNIIEPPLSKQFIHDSYANQKGKGTLKAIQRFHTFKRKANNNFIHSCFVLKADIKHYFDTVSHERLLQILARTITCTRTLTLIRIILVNHNTTPH